ncbi:hypothetical protein EZV62_011112 [Acer yangbiense]|uniref:Mitochondrial outer membrane protein porin 2-like n=1 Tax=Acer yangbiense TaxID=1000413 RepID=A0A5C7I580_9ROSI|nr:hypothetical protein EZV62_011112 [Acer yangbiense]
MSNSQSQHKKKEEKIFNKGPGLFPEISKEAKDLLNKGYIEDDVFSSSTRNNIRVSLTTVVKHGRHSTSNIAASYKNATVGIKIDSKSQTFSSAVENGRLSNSNIAAKYAYKNATVDVNVDSKSNLSATIGFRGQFLPSTKTTATLKLPAYSSSKVQTPNLSIMLEFQYLYKHNALVTSLVLSQSPSVSLTATIGNPTMAFRMKAVCKTGHGFTKYDAGIHLANPNCNASIILANKCDLLKASYVHRFHQPVKIAVGAEITRRFSTKENTFTVTGSCKVDQMTILTAWVNNHGKLNTLLLHKIRHKFSLSISSEFDTKALDKVPRIGLALALML